MKVVVSGTRRSRREQDVRREFEWLKLGPGDVVAHGKCHLGGVDLAADAIARERGCEVLEFPVDFFVDGPWPGAGPRRNRRMIEAVKPDMLLAFPDRRSRGTRNAIKIARELGIPVKVREG